MNLMSAMGGISDKHIVEFAYASPKRGRIKLLMKIASAAACLAVIIGVIAAVPPVLRSGIGLNYPNEALPHVYFNDRAYVIYGRSSGYAFSELPDGYVQVGEITTNDRNNKKVNGYGEMLRIGEKIYQNPEFPEDVYVYTTLFTGGERYWYLLFTDHTYERVRINGKTYVWDFGEDCYLKELPDRYVFIGEVTTNDRDNRYTDGYGQELNIGDKIYQNPTDPDVVYVYTNIFLSDDYYVRFAANDTLSDDDTSSNDETSSTDYPVTNMPPPLVVVNGDMYIIDGDNTIEDGFNDSLPGGYELIGEVTCSGSENSGKEGFGAWFAVGNKVYQHPDKPEEVYVYTTFMTGGERYWYVRCVNSDVHNREAEEREGSVRQVVINERTYVFDAGSLSEDSLSDEYTVIGEVLYVNNNSVWEEGYALGFNVGDEIYQDPDFSGDLYVYSTFVNRGEFGYMRLVDAETLKLEGKDKHIF